MRIPKKISGLLEDPHEETREKIRHFQKTLVHLHFEGKASRGKNMRQAREALGFFNREVSGHMDQEEKILFPFLETHLPRLGPFLSVLRAEHRDFKKKLRHFEFCLDKFAEDEGGRPGKIMERLKETGTYLIYLLQNHLREETEVLYKIADRELRREEKSRLINRIRVLRPHNDRFKKVL